MFSPADGNEWIEFFYSGGDNNFSNLEFSDNSAEKDKIVCCNFQPNCSILLPNDTFFLILDQDTTLNISPENYFFCVDDNRTGNGLSEKDKIILREGDDVLINISYNTTSSEGNSISLINETWLESLPTPWQPNVVYEVESHQGTDLEVSVNVETVLFADVEYDSLFKIRNLDYPESKERINITFYYNITKEDENHTLFIEEITAPSLISYTTTHTGNARLGSGAYTICGEILSSTVEDTHLENNQVCGIIEVKDTSSVQCNISISIDTEKQIYDNNEKIEFYNLLSNESFPYELTYWVEDLFGDIVKNKVVTTNTNKKTYTPDIEDNEKVLFIKSQINNIACNNFLRHPKKVSLRSYPSHTRP